MPTTLGVLTLGLLLAWFCWGGNDDQFITFRYAHNLRSGAGFVYNIADKTLSTTAPLYAILLAALGLIWQDLPVVSNTISLAAIVASGALLIVWAQSFRQRGVALGAAALLVLSPPMLMTTGAETAVLVMLVLGAFKAHARSHYHLAAGSLTVATMVRPDAAAAAAALAIYHLIRHRSLPWKAAALYLAVIGLWFAGLWLYFGSPIPVTLQAKQQQANMGISTSFAAGFLAWVLYSLRQPLNWIHLALAIVGVWSVAKGARHWLPLLLWAVLHFTAYAALGVSGYYWYYAALIPAVAVLIAEGAATASGHIAQAIVWLERPPPWRSAQERHARMLAVGISVVLLVTLLVPGFMGVIRLAWEPDARSDVYREIGHWLQTHTNPEDTIGALEVGIVGYYSQRPMIGFAGLIQPDIARQLPIDGTFLDSARWAIRTHEPDYVLLQGGLASSLPGEAWFTRTHQGVRSFTNGGPLVADLYRRVEGQ